MVTAGFAKGGGEAKEARCFSWITNYSTDGTYQAEQNRILMKRLWDRQKSLDRQIDGQVVLCTLTG